MVKAGARFAWTPRGTYSGPVHLLGNATIGAQNTSSGTISGVISDGNNGYSVTKLGAQTVILTGANSYSGGTIISNATLQIGNGLVNGTLPGNVVVAVSNTTLSFRRGHQHNARLTAASLAARLGL